MDASNQYETLELKPTDDIQSILADYQRRGFKVVHAYYVPGGNYRFLVSKSADSAH